MKKMDKKAFLAADVQIWVVAFLVLAGLAVLFGFLFTLASPDFFIRNYFDDSNIIHLDEESNYLDFVNIYLNTPIKFNNKITTIKEILPLYCMDLDEKYLAYIKRISPYLFPNYYWFTVGCIDEKSKCENTIYYNRAFIIDGAFKKLILKSEIRNPVPIDLPYIKNNKPCLIVESKANVRDHNYKIDPSSTNKEFNKRISKISETINPVLSPNGELWYFTDKGFCNINKDDCVNAIFFTKEDIINCNGDYECLI